MHQSSPAHWFINYSVFKEQSPTKVHHIIKDIHLCFVSFIGDKSSDLKKLRKCSERGGRYHTLLNIRQVDEIVSSVHVKIVGI